MTGKGTSTLLYSIQTAKESSKEAIPDIKHPFCLFIALSLCVLTGLSAMQNKKVLFSSNKVLCSSICITKGVDDAASAVCVFVADAEHY